MREIMWINSTWCWRATMPEKSSICRKCSRTTTWWM